jgi:hypothetical protein
MKGSDLPGLVAILTIFFILVAEAFGLGKSSMIVILPDTQNYVEWKRSGVSNQINWIVSNHVSSNILFVGHVGDIVNDYDTNPDQWAFMQNEYGRLTGAGIPYAVSTGNHDYKQGTRDSTMMNGYFPLSSFTSMPTYGGAYDSSCENTYHIVNINGLEWLILSLEFGPRSAVLEWATEVLATHSNKPALLITHAYLNVAGELFIHSDNHAASNGYGLGGGSPDVNDGTNIWNTLVYSNNNVRMVVCGHDGATNVGARLKIGTNINGRAVCEVLSNYQYYNTPTYSGYMLLVDFLPDGTASFRTYSPVLNQTYTSPESSGNLDLTGFMPDPGDLDRDGIADSVEYEWGGDCDPNEVTPGGRYTYLQTYVLDYKPDSTNLFALDFCHTEAQIGLQFPSTNSRLYTAEYNDSLTNDSGWAILASQTGTNGITTLFLDSAAEQRFYRVRVDLPE